jgi:hypothetical protein
MLQRPLIVHSYPDATMFSALLNAAEKEFGIDLDGDGKVGGGSKAPMPRPQEQSSAVGQSYSGRHRALFIGINYVGSSAELRGCINDVVTMQKMLGNLGFDLSDFRSLTEDAGISGHAGLPTKANILAQLDWLVEGAAAGDTLFLHYSGHGTSVEDRSGDEDDGKDEALVPLDYETAGIIVDDDIYEMVAGRLADGVRLTAVLDCCHSGTLMDLPYMFTATGDNLAAGSAMARRSNRNKYANRTCFSRDQASAVVGAPQVLMFSGCQDDQTSADVSNTASFDVPATDAPGSAGGACTNAMAEVLHKTPTMTFAQLLTAMRENLDGRGFSQIPQMSSSDRVDLGAVFSLWGSFAA